MPSLDCPALGSIFCVFDGMSRYRCARSASRGSGGEIRVRADRVRSAGILQDAYAGLDHSVRTHGVAVAGRSATGVHVYGRLGAVHNRIRLNDVAVAANVDAVEDTRAEHLISCD